MLIRTSCYASRRSLLNVTGRVLLISVVLLLSGTWSQASRQLTPLSPEREQQLFGQINEIPAMITQGTLLPEQVPDPHWRKDACQSCHAGPASSAKENLRYAEINQLCLFCHDPIFDHSYIHPVDVKPDAAMVSRMPNTYRDSINDTDGTLSCLTCHELPAQCLDKRRIERSVNPLFLRNAPYQTRTQQCFYCHDPKQYARLNPHDQVDEDGRWREGSCEICHSDNTDYLRKVSGLENLGFNIKGDLSSMCEGCHPRQPHPGGGSDFAMLKRETKDMSDRPNHLVVPTRKTMKWIRKQSEKTGLVVLFEPGSGRIFCATCHNPHEQGVVENGLPVDGKDDNHRLRVGLSCITCHNK